VRRLLTAVLVAGMIGAWATPALADHGGPVDGVWWARDLDGSFEWLSVSEHGGDSDYFTVVLADTRATGACTPAAAAIASSFDATFDDGSANPEGRKVLYVDFNRIKCAGRSRPTLASFHAEFEVLIDNWSMVDDSGVVWHHIRG
jgi:hypothetical protein